MARILVAEDDQSMRDFLALALNKKGHEVVLTTDGGSALEALREGHFDLLIADIVMPVMDGIALALNAGAEKPDLPVILMTGYSAEQQRAYNLSSLVGAVIAKPFTVNQLDKLIDGIV